MGVPKFFRYISERYPCLSEKLKEYQIPEFDNLYLDMNGIIHNCSHPNDADVSFRITEEKIFKNIFHYIEILFRMIQPQKLFFMAVDGVAPRAKINQQRGRRFRAAKDAELQEVKARSKGQEIPKEARFDSNCITPGTVFMSKLNEQLKYFITHKISTDKLWQKCKIILSGSEVPGEGEHKIMDYIRYMKAQPDYGGNTRHCLYGLDADLIMLGLCSHEPHFSLLREEVKFGKTQKKILTPEETNFCLLHLSLMREYLEHEFSSIKDRLPFKFDIEKIIDDWVLMGFLVGNDFIPNLPNLHIDNDALPILYDVYMEVLPTLGGYINEAGTLNLERFEIFMEKLAKIDIESFDETYTDLKFFEAKTGRRMNSSKKNSPDENSTPKKTNKALDALIKATKTDLGGFEEDENDNESDNEMDSQLNMQLEFNQHKRDYYMEKMKYGEIDAKIMCSQAEGYVRAIQWNLHYYYNGCCSWSWYYPHHYAPFISDIKNFKNLKLEFEMGKPFQPFEQLLAVLPVASKSLLPEAYHCLMTEEHSPIIEYYPLDFKTDLNGKKQEWEAVVLIPFIDEKNLLKAMAPCNAKLTAEERKRNQHGQMAIFTYTEKDLGIYQAPEYFDDVRNHAEVQLMNSEEILVQQEKLVKGLCKDVRLSVYYPGFPTLQHIPHTCHLENAKVKVFEQLSRRENMILTVLPRKAPPLMELAKEWIGKTIFVNWPHLVEAIVVGVSNSKIKIDVKNLNLKDLAKKNIEFSIENMDDRLVNVWNSQRKLITENYKTRLGVEIGNIDTIVHACVITGRQYIYCQGDKMTLEKQWQENSVGFAYQAIVNDISVYNPEFIQFKSVTDIFKPKDICFMLGHPYYGSRGEVIEPIIDIPSGRIYILMHTQPEPDLKDLWEFQEEVKTRYMSGSIAAQRLGINSHLLSRITGTIFVVDNDAPNASKYNIGLNLKFNKKNEEVKGFTKKDQNGSWLYSLRTVEYVKRYMNEFPKLFECLERNSSTGDMLFKEDLYPNDSSKTFESIVTWVKEQSKSMNITVRPCGIEELESEVIEKIEIRIEAYNKTFECYDKKLNMQIKPHLLYKPGLKLGNFLPDTKAQHRLMDRVVCIRDSFTVPIGYKGTIVGIQKGDNPQLNMYEVLFDKPFEGGLIIHSCSANRGYRMAPTDFINISYGFRIENKSKNESSQFLFKQEHQQQQKQLPSSNFQQQQNLSRQSSVRAPDPSILNNVYPNFSKSLTNKQNSGQFGSIKANFSDLSKNISPFPSPPKILQRSIKPPEVNKNVKQNKPQTEASSEFQAIWNDLNKMSVESQQKKPPLAVKEQFSKLPSASKDMPQDPSAFLKAMLKISDDSTPQSSKMPTATAATSVPKVSLATTTPTTSSKPLAFPTAVPQTPKNTDTPTLVQQMFDHARKSENKGGWYCGKLLAYYQARGTSFPRYEYCTNKDNLVCAQVTLPDMRIFCSNFCKNSNDASENVAKKAYQSLICDESVDQVQQQQPIVVQGPIRQPHPQPPPQPQPWYGNRSGVPMPPANMAKPRLPAAFPQNPMMSMPLMPGRKWNPLVQQPSGYGPTPPQPSGYGPTPPQPMPHQQQHQRQYQHQRPMTQHQQYHYKSPQKFSQKPLNDSNVDNQTSKQMSPNKSTSFVPLQAQKKTRNVTNKQQQQKQQQTAMQQQQQSKSLNKEELVKKVIENKVEQKAKENMPSELKKEDKQNSNNNCTETTAAQNSQSQNTQKSQKQRRSRVAARFQAPLANGNDKQ